MVFEVSGVVEVKTEPQINSPADWSYVDSLDRFMLWGDEFSLEVFGLAKAGAKYPAPLAHRGSPLDGSHIVQQHARKNASRIEEHGLDSEMVEFVTFATWDEIKQVAKELNLFPPESKNWSGVFQLLAALEKQHKPQEIRLVLYGSW